VSAWTVGLAALLTALATGLGALPLLRLRTVGRRSLALADAAAAGFMLAATLALAVEGVDRGWGRTALGALAGLVALAAAGRLLHRQHELTLGTLRGVDATKALAIVAVMTVHSLAEGIGVGVAWGEGEALGVFITLAIAVHNIPEGLAISLVLVPRGVGVGRAAWWSVFSSLPQPLLAVPAFVFVESFGAFLPVGLGFAAGAMLWMVVFQLLPEARAGAGGRAVLASLALAFAAMVVLQAFLRGA
jgi:zinc transporter ZupT